MPGGDRTGPMGMGPMTGRAAGFCAGYNIPGYMNPYGGRGMGFGRAMGGRGGGFGRRGGFVNFANPAVQTAYQPGVAPAPANDAMELEALRNQAQSIESTLSGIQQRIEELESKLAELSGASPKEPDGLPAQGSSHLRGPFLHDTPEL